MGVNWIKGKRDSPDKDNILGFCKRVGNPKTGTNKTNGVSESEFVFWANQNLRFRSQVRNSRRHDTRH